MKRIQYGINHLVFSGLLSLLIVSCGRSVPSQYEVSSRGADTYPDYSGLVIPYNIAPLNFMINEDAEEYLTRIYSSNGEAILTAGQSVEIDLKAWSRLLEMNKGEKLYVEIYLKREDGWVQYTAKVNSIAEDPIDEYIAYRIIQPLYSIYEDIYIRQRNLTNFDEKTVYDNFLMTAKKEGQCVNCHSFQDYNRTGKMQLHVRGRMGGTLIIDDDKIEKVNLKTDQTISGGVYPSWHPKLNLVAYSVNSIGQNFHTKDVQKVEVHDTRSDLILYDIDKNEVRTIVSGSNAMENLPYWSPDGKTLYFSSCSNFLPDTIDPDKDAALHYSEIRYDLLKIPFDMETLEFGEIDTLFNSSAIGKSATFPRVSPDGAYMIFTMGNYGNFHIWHKSADLYLLNMQTGELRNMEEVNSPDVESYHSWSSNGHWVIFSSRREDGAYTRFYLTHFEKDGSFTKPFILPQEDPGFYKQFFYSFNIPEFMVNPVKVKPKDLVKAIKKDSRQASYRE